MILLKISREQFTRDLKTFLFSRAYSSEAPLRMSVEVRDKWTYLLTYLLTNQQVTWLASSRSEAQAHVCCDYFSSSSVVSRAFSALCVYSKFRHHPHPLWLPMCQISFLSRPPLHDQRWWRSALTVYFLFLQYACKLQQGFIQACFYSPPPKKNLQFPPKHFCHVGNYNLNVEGKSNANYLMGICYL